MKISFAVFLSLAIAVPSFCQFSDFKSTDFKKADSIADLYSNFDLRYQKKLTRLLIANLSTEVEKFRAIFKWITNNISYDVEMLREINKKEVELKNDRKKLEKWRQRTSNQLQKRLVVNKSAICQGYSTLLEAMCEFAGIQCKIIEGYGRTLSQQIGYGKVNHAWNAVNLNNEWHLCDVTWASGYITNEFSDFNKHFNEDYFLSDPSLFVADHYPKDISWILSDDKPSLKQFLNSPDKSNGFIANKINNYRPADGIFKIKTTSPIRFSFNSNLPMKSLKRVSVEVREKIKNSYKLIDDTDYDLLIDSEGHYYFEYKLYSKGEFRIRIFINRKLAFAYEVISK